MYLLHKLAKGFDHVDWNKLFEILRKIGVNWREVRLIRSLNMRERVKQCLNQGETNALGF